MCDKCVTAGGDESEGRVHSIADISTQLIDAFMESDGEHKSVVFVDSDDDAYELRGITYDAKNKCIKIKVTSAYVGIRDSEMGRRIAQVNGS